MAKLGRATGSVNDDESRAVEALRHAMKWWMTLAKSALGTGKDPTKDDKDNFIKGHHESGKLRYG